jgi:murein L,D-transpeptidase YcbB/YkuD
MMPGESGDRVKWVQRRLAIAQSGSFDTTMEKALASFQKSKGITAEAGVIGPATFARLCWVRVD